MKGFAVFLAVAVVIIIGVFIIRAHESAPATPEPLPLQNETPASTSTPLPPESATSTQASSTEALAQLRTITADDLDATVTFGLHERFLLRLGDAKRTVSFSPEGIVERVPNTIDTDGYQGVYELIGTGTTTLTAKTATKTFTATIVSSS